MMGNHNNNRERLSWSEIDKRKDKGGSRKPRGDGDRDDRPRSPSSMSRYKQKLEQLFSPAGKSAKSGAKLSDEQREAFKKLQSTTDRSEFQVQADAYLQQFGLPNDWEYLETFLRHKAPEILKDVIARMEAQLPEQTEVRKGNFQKDLQLIEMTTRDKDLRKQVSELLKKF